MAGGCSTAVLRSARRTQQCAAGADSAGCFPRLPRRLVRHIPCTIRLTMCHILTARFRYGQTALHAAASEGHEDCCRKLLNAGASASLPDLKGQLPIECARKESTRELLRSRGRYQSAKASMPAAAPAEGNSPVTTPKSNPQSPKSLKRISLGDGLELERPGSGVGLNASRPGSSSGPGSRIQIQCAPSGPAAAVASPVVPGIAISEIDNDEKAPMDDFFDMLMRNCNHQGEEADIGAALLNCGLPR